MVVGVLSGGGQRLSMPQERQGVLTGFHLLHELEDGSLDNGQGHNAVTSSRRENHSVGASGSVFLAGIMVREVGTAYIHHFGACRIVVDIQGHHNCAVAAVHCLINLCVGAGGVHRHAVIDIRQGIVTSGHRVIMQIGRVDGQRQGHDGVTAISLLFHDVIDTGGIIAVLSIVNIG